MTSKSSCRSKEILLSGAALQMSTGTRSAADRQNCRFCSLTLPLKVDLALTIPLLIDAMWALSFLSIAQQLAMIIISSVSVNSVSTLRSYGGFELEAYTLGF
jgi:hypothetical protein